MEKLLDEIKYLLLKARIKQAELAETTDEIFRLLNKSKINLELPTNAENANNLDEAINCYILYGEYGLPKLMKEIKKAYKKEDN